MKWQRLPRKYEKEFYIQHLIIIYLSWRRHTDTITTDTHKKRIHLLRCSHECGEGTKSMGKRESGREKEREHIRKINVPRTHPVVFVDSMYQILLQTSNTTHTHTHTLAHNSRSIFFGTDTKREWKIVECHARHKKNWFIFPHEFA